MHGITLGFCLHRCSENHFLEIEVPNARLQLKLTSSRTRHPRARNEIKNPTQESLSGGYPHTLTQRRRATCHGIISPASKQRVDTPKMGGTHNATEDEFVIHSVPRCLDDQGEKLQGVGLSGARVESLPRRVTISPREPVFLGMES